MKTNVNLVTVGFGAKPIIVNYKCPYCGRESQNHDDIARCHGMCHLATLIEAHFIDRGPEDKWNPPHRLADFKAWTNGDRHEFARRLEAFFNKFYR